MHVGINHKGNLPVFVTVTDAKQHEVKVGREVNFPKGSIVVVDKGYTDNTWNKTQTRVFTLLHAINRMPPCGYWNAEQWAVRVA